MIGHTATEPVLHLVRDYYRGCVYCDDAEQGSEDFEHLTGEEPTVYVREVPVLQRDHVSVLALLSGRPAIGDADRCN